MVRSLHGVLKPFDKLKKEELQEELLTRGIVDVELDKKDLLNTLNSILKGAPILLTNPSQCLNLSSMRFWIQKLTEF